MTPRLSAIVSLYNARRFAAGCLDDLIAQSLAADGSLEVVVVDAASPEQDHEIVAPYAARYPWIRLVRLPERVSLYEAWNIGIREARGTYITNANADDRRHPDALARHVALLDADHTLDLAWSDCRRSTVENARWHDAPPDPKVYRYPEQNLAGTGLLHFQLGIHPVWRRTVHERIGMFDGSFRACGDWDFNIRCNMAGLRGRNVGEVLGLYYVSSNTLSFADDTNARENARIKAQWQTHAHALAAMALEGMPVDTPTQRAEALARLAERAAHHPVPWGAGTRADEGFARALVAWAQDELATAARAVPTRVTPPSHPAPAAPSTPQDRATRITALSLGTSDYQGAGSATVRMQEALVARGVETSMLVLEKHGTSPLVQLVRPSAPSQGMAKAARAFAEAPLRAAGAFAPPAMFTATPSLVPFEELEDRVAKADVVHLHWLDGMLDYEGAARMLRGKPVVLTLHDMQPLTGGCHCAFDCTGYHNACAACPQVAPAAAHIVSSSFAARQRLYDAVQPLVIASSSSSAAQARHSALLGAHDVTVVPLPIDLAEFAPMPTRDARLALGLDPQATIVAFGAAGIMRREKGFAYLAEALPHVQQQLGRPITLLVFGATEVPPVGVPVVCAGRVTDMAVLRALYAASDVVAFPSRQETFGMTVAEALACGTPVVGFPTGVVPDIVVPGENGAIAAMADAGSLADALVTVLRAMQVTPAPWRAAARASAERHVCPSKVGEALEAVYRRAMARAGGAIAPSAPIRVREVAPRISIVVPHFNQGAYLGKCLDSVLSQEYPNLELIVMDGGSTDGSVELLQRYGPRLSHWESERDRGQSHAINKGLARATGDAWNWLCGDDWLEPGALAALAATWQRHRHAAGWVGGAHRWLDNGALFYTSWPNGLATESLKLNWGARLFYQPAAFLSLPAVKAVGGVNESLHYAMEFELYRRVLEHGPFVRGDGVWCSTLSQPNAKTVKDRDTAWREKARVLREAGEPDAATNWDTRADGGAFRFVVPHTWQVHRNAPATVPSGVDRDVFLFAADFRQGGTGVVEALTAVLDSVLRRPGLRRVDVVGPGAPALGLPTSGVLQCREALPSGLDGYRGAACWDPAGQSRIADAIMASGLPGVYDQATLERLGLEEGCTGFGATDAATLASKAALLTLDPTVFGGMWLQLRLAHRARAA
jgi:glycosyltransferase involved in cell wall biosynthesis